MMPAGRGSRKSSVNAAHEALAVDKVRGRIAIAVAEHRRRLASFVGLGQPGDQRGEVDLEVFAIVTHGWRCLCEIAVALEHQRDDFEALVTMLTVESPQKLRFIVAIRTPCAAERDQHDLAAEALVA